MPQQEDSRWCIFIDILGFSRFWECDRSKAYASLRAMMRTIHAIGAKSFPETPNRLFVHQMGDGFAILSEFGEESFGRPIAIATALMRCVATTGAFAAAAIAEGDLADITGCYPSEIFVGDDRRTTTLGHGVMTISPVMGTAFIRAYRLGRIAPPGPFLVISEAHRDRVPASLQLRTTLGRNGQSLCSIDWIRYQSEYLAQIRRSAGIHIPTASELQSTIQAYCKEYPSIRDKWACRLRDLLDTDV